MQTSWNSRRLEIIFRTYTQCPTFGAVRSSFPRFNVSSSGVRKEVHQDRAPRSYRHDTRRRGNAARVAQQAMAKRYSRNLDELAKTCHLGQQALVVTFDQSGSKDSREAILKVKELHNENISCLRRQSRPSLPGQSRQGNGTPVKVTCTS